MWWCRWFWFLLFVYNANFLLSQSFPQLLLVSFDGFRYDYPKLYGPLESFSRLEQRGVHAHSMMSTFNTATFPNHYTLITGLYEEVHGLVSDQVYDPQTQEVFQDWHNITSHSWPFKTIWKINEEREGARSGVIGWPQNHSGISRSIEYSKDRSHKEIIDQVLSWFDGRDHPINFGSIYFSEPDLTGHRFGPHSNEMREAVRQCDQSLGYLLNRIDMNEKLKNNLHLIITSDHGMEEIQATDRAMYLEDFVDMTKLKAFGTETVLNIFLHSYEDLNTILYNLSRIPHSRTYRKEDIPSQYHYKNNAHIGDLIVILEPGYELYRQYGGRNVYSNTKHGNHGYNNEIDSMKTIFYASGPQLKSNFTLSNTSSLANVDLFGLMCLILNIDKCPPSNGSLANIQPFLLDSSRVLHIMDKEIEKMQDGPMGLVIYLLVLVSFVLILIMAVVWTTVSFRNTSSLIRAAASRDPTTIAEQNQFKFTQINDQKLNVTIQDQDL